MSSWRSDPDLAKRLHPEHRDDLEVVVHDGEPRRTQRTPESCWVRVTALESTTQFPLIPQNAPAELSSRDADWIERRVYRGILLNQPHQLKSVRAGDPVLFLHAPGMPAMLQVTPAYLAERAGWAFRPCDRCGTDQAMDPPSVMARTRFPDAPAGSTPIMFTAFCPCGGTMILTMLSDFVAAAEGPASTGAAKPWWKFW